MRVQSSKACWVVAYVTQNLSQSWEIKLGSIHHVGILVLNELLLAAYNFSCMVFRHLTSVALVSKTEVLIAAVHAKPVSNTSYEASILF